MNTKKEKEKEKEKEFIEKLRKVVERELRAERTWSICKRDVLSATKIQELLDIFIDGIGACSGDEEDFCIDLLIRMWVPNYRRYDDHDAAIQKSSRENPSKYHSRKD